MQRFGLVLVGAAFLLGCAKRASEGKPDDAKDKEIAALKAKLAATTAKAAEAKPPATVEEKKAAARIVRKAQLDRIAADGGDADAAILANVAKADAPDNKSTTIANLYDDPMKYVGRPWRTTGKVLEVENEPTYHMLQLTVGDSGGDSVFVYANKEIPAKEGQQLDVVGYLIGSWPYESILHIQMTAPALAARAIVPGGTLDLIAAGKTRAEAEKLALTRLKKRHSGSRTFTFSIPVSSPTVPQQQPQQAPQIDEACEAQCRRAANTSINALCDMALPSDFPDQSGSGPEACRKHYQAEYEACVRSRCIR